MDTGLFLFFKSSFLALLVGYYWLYEVNEEAIHTIQFLGNNEDCY